MADVATDIKKIISEHLGFNRRPVEDSDALVADLGCDSLDSIELVMALEAEFGISIPDDDVEDFATMTVQELVELVEKHQTASAA